MSYTKIWYDICDFYSTLPFLKSFIIKEDICNDLKDNQDIMRQVRAVYTRGNMLVHKFKICSQDVKHCLYKSYCSNSSGSQLWSVYIKVIYKKAVGIYNNVNRNLFKMNRGDSISAIFVLNNIDSFNVLVRKDVYAFRQRIKESANLLLRMMMMMMMMMVVVVSEEEVEVVVVLLLMVVVEESVVAAAVAEEIIHNLYNFLLLLLLPCFSFT